jgi:hypothetical protein
LKGHTLLEIQPALWARSLPTKWHDPCLVPRTPKSKDQLRAILARSHAQGRGDVKVKLAATMELYAYWNQLRGRRSAPERNTLDPGALRGVLADTFVLDFDGERGFPFRIAGSRANALFLQELRGLSFLDLWRHADREEVDSILHSVADEAQAFLIGAEAGPPGLEPVGVEIILMPLRHHGLTHSRVLGGLVTRAAPAWTGLIGAGPIALTSLRALDSSAREDGAASLDFSLRDMPRRYKHLFVYPGDRTSP